ncbi:G-type lectin S-receptor-like serine/threonine-protein kinase [Dichanthelium oligosanthes]|uniref:non-specific serine/threonine protein kinase n=1 Tax=Dichanthelium oligosanthes TaxID=888268 RepID=A0A1E5WAY5_9POAL|nr:G-type lectin S-receptor-like serine/threonine-protein kinase [Dichanthelium oligosanthes]
MCPSHPIHRHSNFFQFCSSMNLQHIFLGLLLLASLHTPPCSAAGAADTLAAGQALAVGDRLVSRNGKFALGFFQPTSAISKSNITTSPNWYLGIWFHKIPVCTTVWVANREEPITDPKLQLTQLKISSDGDLVIVNHDGSTESTVWSTRIANTSRTGSSTNTTTAVLLDSGNLALVESPSSSNVTLWQSFDYPTDVVLPGAKFGRNKLTGFNRVGITRKSLIDLGLGSYSVEIDTSGVVLKHQSPSVVYWRWSSGASTLKLIPILKTMLESNPQTKGLIDPVYVDDDAEEYYMYTSLDNSSLTFVSLDISGQIKLNVWSQAQQSWQAIFSQPADPCTPYGTCGPFTTCNGTSNPFCEYFGMAAFVGRDFSRVLTTFRGTAGYLAPEWLGGVAITSKVDVYSFGMVLLEIISGRRNSPEAYSSSNYHIEFFPVQAVSKLHEGDVQSLVDPQLHGDFNLEEAERVCKVACWCIQDNELDRPTMGEVVRVLEALQEIDMPPVPRLLAAITQGPGGAIIAEGSDSSLM